MGIAIIFKVAFALVLLITKWYISIPVVLILAFGSIKSLGEKVTAISMASFSLGWIVAFF